MADTICMRQNSSPQELWSSWPLRELEVKTRIKWEEYERKRGYFFFINVYIFKRIGVRFFLKRRELFLLIITWEVVLGRSFLTRLMETRHQALGASGVDTWGMSPLHSLSTAILLPFGGCVETGRHLAKWLVSLFLNCPRGPKSNLMLSFQNIVSPTFSHI